MLADEDLMQQGTPDPRSGQGRDSRPDPEVTELLQAMQKGDAKAADALYRRMEAELMRIASRLMRDQKPGHTLQATALIGEMYLRLVDRKKPIVGRSHFLALAARLMRHVLVDHAKRKKAAKRAGWRVPMDVVDSLEFSFLPEEDLVALDEALTSLAREHERAAKAIEMYYFGGCTKEEIGEPLQISPRTVARDLAFGYAWLRRHLCESDDITKPAEHC